jgi:hypothetical protein
LRKPARGFRALRAVAAKRIEPDIEIGIVTA